jgi:hypothetical protein
MGKTGQEINKEKNMETKIYSRAAKMTLRLGLAGLGLLLWHSPSAKAQECCSGDYTTAELAKFENSAKKPVTLAASSDKLSDRVLVAKLETSVAPAANFSRKDGSKNAAAAKFVAVKQPVKNADKE